jgi:hypothetical protein
MIAASNKLHPAKNLDAGWLLRKIFGIVIHCIKKADKGFVAGKEISQRMVVFANNANQASFPGYL